MAISNSMSSLSSTVNFQVQHQVVNDVKVIYSTPNNNLFTSPVFNLLIGGTCPTVHL